MPVRPQRADHSRRAWGPADSRLRRRSCRRRRIPRGGWRRRPLGHARRIMSCSLSLAAGPAPPINFVVSTRSTSAPLTGLETAAPRLCAPRVPAGAKSMKPFRSTQYHCSTRCVSAPVGNGIFRSKSQTLLQHQNKCLQSMARKFLQTRTSWFECIRVGRHKR